MPKVLLASIAAVALAGALVATSLAQDGTSQTVVAADAHVTPSKAGTASKPRGVQIKVHVTWATPGDLEKPIVQSVDVLFPKGSKYNGAKFPKCDQNTLARQGLQGCPKGSIMGTGGGDAWADTVITHPQITVVNGGASDVYLYTVMNNPARVQAPVPGKITRMSGQWAYKLHLEVPRVLQIVAGVPIALKEITVTAGKGDWLATTACPASHKWPFSLESFYSTGGSTVSQSTVACS